MCCFCQKASVDTPFIPFTRNIFRTKKYHSLISEYPSAPNHLISNIIPQWHFSFLFTKKYHRSIIEVSFTCIKLLSTIPFCGYIPVAFMDWTTDLWCLKHTPWISPTAWGTEPPNVGFHSPLCGENTDGRKGYVILDKNRDKHPMFLWALWLIVSSLCCPYESQLSPVNTPCRRRRWRCHHHKNIER